MTTPRASILRTTPAAVLSLDRGARVTALNAAAERLFSATATDAIGRPVTEVIGASLGDRLLPLFLRTASEPGMPHHLDVALPDGRTARLRASIGPLRDARGAASGMLLVAEEVGVPSEREERLRGALRRYIGATLAASVEERPSFVGIGATRRTLSVLHADVRGFSALAERRPPEEVADLLVRYHAAGFEALHGTGATVDRFVGDAVLAFWNAPTEQPDHARRAIAGALAFRHATRAVGDELAYGIGVHTGDAVVGNLGSERLMHYTAIGDTVNVAARLQSAAEARTILASAALVAAAGPGLDATRLGPIAVKGRDAPVDAYRVVALR
jgi:PAS domain S-box-containing protein